MNKFSCATLLSGLLVASIFIFATAHAAGETATDEASKAGNCEALWKDIIDIDMGTKHMQGVVADPANEDKIGAQKELDIYLDLRVAADAKFAAANCTPPS